MDAINATSTISSQENLRTSVSFPQEITGNRTEPIGDLELHIVVLLTSFYSFVFILGLTGNGLVIYSIKRCRKLHNVTCVLLANLAAADIILIVCVLPFKLTTSFIHYWGFGAAVCRLLPFLQVLSPACSVFTMTAISLERYYAVIYPLQARAVLTLGRAKKVVISLWVVSIIYSIPAVYSKNFTRQRFEGFDETVPNCNDGWSGQIIQKAYALYLFIFIFAIPLIVVTYCYARVILTLQRSDLRESHRAKTLSNINTTKCLSTGELKPSDRRFLGLRREMDDTPVPASRASEETISKVFRNENQATNSRIAYVTDRKRSTRRDEKRITQIRRTQYCWFLSNKFGTVVNEMNSVYLCMWEKVVLMLVVVVLLFVFLWGPVLLYNVLLRFGLGIPNNWTTWRISVAFHLMAYFNSCTNPVVYCFVSKQFRKSFLTVMCCRREESEKHGFKLHWSTTGKSRCNTKLTMPSARKTRTSCSHV